VHSADITVHSAHVCVGVHGAQRGHHGAARALQGPHGAERRRCRLLGPPPNAAALPLQGPVRGHRSHKLRVKAGHATHAFTGSVSACAIFACAPHLRSQVAVDMIKMCTFDAHPCFVQR